MNFILIVDWRRLMCITKNHHHCSTSSFSSLILTLPCRVDCNSIYICCLPSVVYGQWLAQNWTHKTYAYDLIQCNVLQCASLCFVYKIKIVAAYNNKYIYSFNNREKLYSLIHHEWIWVNCVKTLANCQFLIDILVCMQIFYSRLPKNDVQFIPFVK